jgi:hypothetical protein
MKKAASATRCPAIQSLPYGTFTLNMKERLPLEQVGWSSVLVGRNFDLRLYVVEQKEWNENRKYCGSGGVAGSFAERKFS